jgi:hypothetical protein
MPGIHTLVRSACCSVLVLSTVSTCAGPGVSSVYRLGVPQAGMGQTAMAPTPGMPDPVAQVAPEPPTATLAVASPGLIALADPSLASTAAKREQLKYLVRCALPADLTLYADQEGTRFTFPGGLGLAPRWVDEAMTPSEERWVSACLLYHFQGILVHPAQRPTPACWGVTAGCTSIFQIWYYSFPTRVGMSRAHAETLDISRRYVAILLSTGCPLAARMET